MRFPKRIPSILLSLQFPEKHAESDFGQALSQPAKSCQGSLASDLKKIRIKALKVYKCRKSLKWLTHQPAQNEPRITLCSMFLAETRKKEKSRKQLHLRNEQFDCMGQ